MKVLRTFAVLALVSLMAGGVATAMQVKTDYDKAYDFSKVKTFSVKLGTSWNNEIGEKRVVEAVEAKLASLGWAKADEATADAHVVIHGATTQKQDLQTFYTGYAGGYGWGGWGMGMGTATTTSVTYTEGTLVLDIFDRGSQALFFRASANDTLSTKAEKNQKKLVKALNKIFYDFPPKPPKSK